MRIRKYKRISRLTLKFPFQDRGGIQAKNLKMITVYITLLKTAVWQSILGLGL